MMSEDTNQEQAKDDNDRGNVLLQQSHAEEREKKGNEARNQGIQVVLKSGNSCGFKEISACELGNSCVDSFCTGGKCIPVDEGSFCVRDDRYREHKVNADPALDQSTQDEHTEDGSDLCDFAERKGLW